MTLEDTDAILPHPCGNTVTLQTVLSTCDNNFPRSCRRRCQGTGKTASCRFPGVLPHRHSICYGWRKSPWDKHTLSHWNRTLYSLLSNINTVPAAQRHTGSAPGTFLPVNLHPGAKRFIVILNPSNSLLRILLDWLAYPVVGIAFFLVNVCSHNIHQLCNMLGLHGFDSSNTALFAQYSLHFIQPRQSMKSIHGLSAATSRMMAF